MKLIAYVASILFLCLPDTSNAQTNPALDNYLGDVYKRHIIPGFAVVVVKKGQMVYSRGYGVESVGSKRPFTSQTVSPIGSLTKSMTTMAMMQLVEEKKVELDKPVSLYLPWFRTANRERSDKITVRMLLNNTSGLYSNSSSESDDATDNSLDNLVRSLSSTFLTREPGISYQYSNAGFSVAGLIISKVSGMPYQQYVHDKIFRPLKMFHTSTDPKDFGKLKSISGHYYGIDKAIASDKDNNIKSDGYIPAGSLMCSSAEDLGKYLISLINSGKDNFLSVQARNEMWEENISFPGVTKEDGGDGKIFSYGLGWMISEIEGRKMIHHGGSTGKASSFTAFDQQNETAASILWNVDLSFINKYSYPTEINIINNIMRLASGLPTSEYGMPKIKDPTINTYLLNDTLLNHYEGDYKLKSENVVFLYAGAALQIRKSGNGLECSIYRDKQVLNQFMIDFVNEALAVSRNIAIPAQLRFRLSPEGNVSGLFFGDMEFILVDKIAGSRYKTVFSTDKKISFQLPGDWQINWQKNLFIAQSSDGHVQLRGCIGNEVKNPVCDSNFKSQLTGFSSKESGLRHSENFGNNQWHQKSFVWKSNSEVSQVITMQSRIENNSVFVVLITREGELTTNIQDVANFLLNSIRVHE
jgi:CubicO group peptidase (beta-lactamase class C family)